MSVQILHRGFDGLKFTVQAEIPLTLRAELAAAREFAKKIGQDCYTQFGETVLFVSPSRGRNFLARTGETGAIWLFQDPLDRIAFNPAITVDFRAFGLATGGLDHAEQHFREVMEALEIPYGEHQLRVTRTDFAVDFLAPWFEPDRCCLIAPPGTSTTEDTGVDETTTEARGARVTGLRAGKIANRQLAIYDKRLEVMQKAKHGWLTIWNAERARCGEDPLDLTDQSTSQVWRFELRLGSKQLRNKFEIHSWADVRAKLGDAFRDAVQRMRYTIPTHDSNRARWPTHELWQTFAETVTTDLTEHRSGVSPSDVVLANRTAKMRELDRQILGLFFTRAAISEVGENEFFDFMDRHTATLRDMSEEHPKTVGERLQKAAGKYCWV
ncbi:hypothetical protein [Neptunicoccus cionae]|uniref:hypothetical protein n=1 Tax=Neptunicoccus cionae TaxID=2035344 RepID=UPI000C7748C4|nr:hypothetical protein [Amylibacter cionae]PLS19842.1 hypothetical protein C0U40_19615 [Amylibacter cionae]